MKKMKYEKLSSNMYLISSSVIIDDVVYMENEAERDEYVLNQYGRIWIGSKRKNYGRRWFFGQVSQ